MLKAWHEYVAVNCGNFQMKNINQYALLKKVAYLYYQKKENDKPPNQIIAEIANETGITAESVKDYLVAVSTFKPKYNADFYASDDEDDYYSSAVDAVEDNLATERIYFNLCQQEKLMDALAELKKPEQRIIE